MKKVENKGEVFYEIPGYSDRTIIINNLKEIGGSFYFKVDDHTLTNLIVSAKQLKKIEAYVLQEYVKSTGILKSKNRRRVLRIQKMISSLACVKDIQYYYKLNTLIPNQTSDEKSIPNKLITNTGYSNICIAYNKDRGLYLLLTISVDKRTYTKTLQLGKLRTYKYALLQLINLRCDIFGEDYPDYVNILPGMKFLTDNHNYIDPELAEDTVMKLYPPQWIINSIARNKNLRIFSDVSNTGYTGIYLYTYKDLAKVDLFVSHANKASTTVRLSDKIGYKEALQNALKARCESYGLEFPLSINYEHGLLWLRNNSCLSLADDDIETLLKDILSTTGYRNIFLIKVRKQLYLACKFVFKKEVYFKSYNLNKTTYKNALDKLLKFKCDILDYAPPKNIDYIKGMDTYLSLINLSKATSN
jgi:hypothetical protein